LAAMTNLHFASNGEAFERAQRVLVGGVNSPVRSFASVGGAPYVVERGEGAWVIDVEGRRYLDYVQSYGAVILGHADERIASALAAQARLGTTFGAPTPGEVRLAELIVERVPGVERVRLTNSGTEATMTAIRLARGATSRSTIVKFDGCYHGHADALLAAAGSGVASLSLPGSVGIPERAVADTRVVPYQEVPRLDEDVAAVIVEPIAANMGLVEPDPGFLEGLRAETRRVGALLIFDEVITGFRVGLGGASSLLGVQPDLWCFGKVIGGGLPIGAVGGPAAIMEHLAPVGAVYQAGTLSGSPIATAAGVAALEALDEGSYRQLEGRATQLAEGLASVIAEAGLPVQVPHRATLLGLFFSEEPVRTYADARRAVASGWYPPFFHAMLRRGVALAPGPYEILFPSLAHSAADIDRTIDIAAAAAREAQAQGPRRA
jgi:glutamate-1-semialdehyde 2,1-aminomutase